MPGGYANRAATPQPLPTPYDITPIPFFPIVPGIVAWIIVAIIAMVIAAIIARVPLSRRGSPASALNTAEKELRSLQSREIEPKELLSGASLIIRRLLAALTSLNLRSATAAEIREFAQAQPDSIQSLLRAAATIEETRFIPAVSREDASRFVEELQSGLRSAREYFAKPERSG